MSQEEQGISKPAPLPRSQAAVVAGVRGRSGIADDRQIFPAIDPAIKQRFLEKKVMYVRNYGEGVDMTWQEAFQSDDRTVVEEIRGLYERTAIRFPWQRGDILLVDNFLVSHGREPFVGPRSILVAMAEPYTSPI